MRVDFKNMPDNSRIWIYQSDRDLNESEISIIDDKTTTFLDSWQAHGKNLECSYSIIYRRFIVIAVNENINPIGGCSIDYSLQLINDISDTIQTNLLNRLIVNYKILKPQLFHQFILFLVMSIVFIFFDLLPAFAVYFVFFHSIPSIIEQAEYLFEDSSTESFKKFIIKGLAYWLIAIIFLGILYLVIKDKIDFSLGIFFSFLAAITFPHVLVIYKMKQITRKN